MSTSPDGFARNPGLQSVAQDQCVAAQVEAMETTKVLGRVSAAQCQVVPGEFIGTQAA
jgi:hypothetical protein